MKFIANKVVLYQALQNVSRAVSGRSTLPILGNVLIDAQKDGVHMVTTDLEIGIQCSLEANVSQAGSLTVPAKMLGEVVGSLPEEEISLQSDENNSLTLTCGKSEYLINGLPAEEFPALPEVSQELSLSISQPDLREMIRKTVFAASLDETRAILTGVLLVWEGNLIKGVATDTHRLAVREIPVEASAEKKITVIVPARALHELSRSLREEDEAQVEMNIGESQILFKMDHLLLVSRLIEGQFPNFERVIPSETPTRISANREELLSAIRRAAIVARAEANKLIFRPGGNGGSLVITAESGEVGKAHEEVAINLEGEAVEIAFNAQYLMDALSVMDSEAVEIGLGGPLNPGLIKPAGATDCLYVVMPMQIL